jgi:hypothetical protein
MSLKEIRKSLQIAGKGENEILEIDNPMEHTMTVTETFEGHVPEDRGTCDSHFCVSS